MKLSKEVLEQHFKQYKGDIIHNMPPNNYYGIMLKYIDKKNFLQILYGMGISYLLILLDLFEQEEEYDYCAIIRDVIDNHNIVSGDNLKTKIAC